MGYSTTYMQGEGSLSLVCIIVYLQVRHCSRGIRRTDGGRFEEPDSGHGLGVVHQLHCNLGR